MKDAWNEAKLANNLRAETSKALGTFKQKNKELTIKLIVEERRRKSAEASLKNTQTQVEEQCQKLHYTEIKLATTKQQVMDLKVELEKAKEAAQEAQAATNAARWKFYDLGVQEIEGQLTDELAGVYRDYCFEVWTKALKKILPMLQSFYFPGFIFMSSILFSKQSPPLLISITPLIFLHNPHPPLLFCNYICLYIHLNKINK